MPQLETRTIPTRDGHTLEVFYNPERDLLVVDLIHRSEQGGNEIIRTRLDEAVLLTANSSSRRHPRPPECWNTGMGRGGFASLIIMTGRLRARGAAKEPLRVAIFLERAAPHPPLTHVSAYVRTSCACRWRTTVGGNHIGSILSPDQTPMKETQRPRRIVDRRVADFY